MGRECRRVPADWEHPKDDDGNHVPMLDKTYEDALAVWNDRVEHWERGEDYSYTDECWKPKSEEALKYATLEEWDGGPPDPAWHRPAYTGEQTHFQMYEDTSEGTPISPVFETAEELARWCADNKVSAFADMTGDYDFWMRVIEGTAGFGMIMDPATGDQKPA